MVIGNWYLVLGTWSDTRNPKPETRHPTPDTRYPTPDTRYPTPDTQYSFHRLIICLDLSIGSKLVLLLREVVSIWAKRVIKGLLRYVWPIF